MSGSVGLETGGDIRRSPEGSELEGDIGKYKKLFFQIFVNFVLPKIYQKG